MATAQAQQTLQTSQTRRKELPRITGEVWRQIVYQGPVRRCFFTSSRTYSGMEHRVYVNMDGTLACDCISAHFRGTCAHKSVVAAVLAEEAQRIARAQAQAEEEAERGWKLTAKGRRALERARKEAEGQAEQGRQERTARATMASTTGLSQGLSRRSLSGASARYQQRNRCDDRADYTPHPGDTAPLRRDNRPFSLMK